MVKTNIYNDKWRHQFDEVYDKIEGIEKRLKREEKDKTFFINNEYYCFDDKNTEIWLNRERYGII